MLELAKKIENLLDEGYEAFGIRHMEGNELNNSHEWIDDEDTGIELDGVCTYDLRVDLFDSAEDIATKLVEALEKSNAAYGHLGRPVLIYGKYGEGGNDINEIVIPNPQMIEI